MEGIWIRSARGMEVVRFSDMVVRVLEAKEDVRARMWTVLADTMSCLNRIVELDESALDEVRAEYIPCTRSIKTPYDWTIDKGQLWYPSTITEDDYSSLVPVCEGNVGAEVYWIR